MSLFQRIRTPFGDGAPEEGPQQAPAAPAVGELLRARREELGLDLESIGEALRIRPSYLAALEEGRAQDLPGPTYAAGFIRAYGQHLGFDGDRVLARYKAQSSEIVRRPELSFPLPLDERSLPGVPILLVGLILALCGYGTWYYLSTGERSRPERVAAVPAELQRTLLPSPDKASGPATPPAAKPGATAPATSAAPPAGPAASGGPASSTLVARPAVALPQAAAPSSALGLSSPAATTEAPGSPASAAPPPEANPPGATPVAATAGEAAASKGIAIRALADCWIRVYSPDDQAAVFERVLKKGETYQVPRAGLQLRTGNAGALAITVDGKAAPAIGRVGTLRRDVDLDPQALLAGTAVHG